MTLSDRLQTLQTQLSSSPLDDDLFRKKAIACMDLTRLDTQATPNEIAELAQLADQYQVASVCVLPQHLQYIPPERLVRRTTVANFPGGDEPLDQVIQGLQWVENAVHEVDYVLPYAAYWGEKKNHALDCCHTLYRWCHARGLVFKVILETGSLPSIDHVHQVSKDVIATGCDFIKTSTGKTPVGATVPAVFAMASAIQDSGSHCGIKISGGIQTPAQAFGYMQLCEHVVNKKLTSDWFRIGASHLVHQLV